MQNERLEFLISTLEAAVKGARAAFEREAVRPDAAQRENELAAAEGLLDGLERCFEVGAGCP